MKTAVCTETKPPDNSRPNTVKTPKPKVTQPMRSLLVVFSYHHKNTEKIAKAFAKVLDAQIKTPKQVDPKELKEYDLIGFGSGIYGAKHHASLLNLANRIARVTNGKAFLFSTYGAPGIAVHKDLIHDNHAALREKLESKGYVIIDEFGCAGHNTNSFLRFFGGLNKGRPNAGDLERAAAFAERIKMGMQKAGARKT
jgi:flavodoxin